MCDSLFCLFPLRPLCPLRLQVPIFIATAALAVRQAFCVVANLTTNELLGRSKYGYLRGTDNSFRCALVYALAC